MDLVNDGAMLVSMARRRLQQKGDLRSVGGWWRLRWREDKLDANGKLVRAWSSTVIVGPSEGRNKMTEREARRLAWENFLSKMDQNQTVPMSMMTVEQFCERRFIPEYAEMKRQSTKTYYKSLIKVHVLPMIGHLRLCDVNQYELQRGLAMKMNSTYKIGKRTSRYSPRLIHGIAVMIGTIIEYAKRVGAFAGDNPASKVVLPEATPVKQRHALTIDQLNTLLEALPEPARSIALTATLTSMNIKEIVGLRWRYVNLSTEWQIVDGESLPPLSIMVRYQWDGKGYVPLKAKARYRIIPMASGLVEALSRPATAQADDPVFASRNNTPVDAHNIFNRILKPVGVKLGMPWIGWHVFRRTNATLADQHGMAFGDRQAMLGHNSAMMTAWYTQGDMNRRRDIMEQIGKKINTAVN